jgi:Xaa-Pro aminopeptidase
MKKNAALEKSMVVTVEPGVYEAGAYGIRIEDLVLLRKDGIEILSRSPKEVIIL